MKEIEQKHLNHTSQKQATQSQQENAEGKFTFTELEFKQESLIIISRPHP